MKRTFVCFLFVILLSFNGSWAQVELSEDMKNVIKNLNLSTDKIDSDLSIEKPMRYIPEMMAFAIMERENKLDNSEYDHFSYTCHVVLYNASDKIITHKYVMKNLWSDAVRISRLNFDFAPYMVKSNTRAFGLRIAYTANSRISPFEEEKITLFVQEKDKLIPVLKDFTSYLYKGDWDGICAGEFNESRAVFVLQPEQNGGFFNVLVNYKDIKTVNTPAAEDCDSKETMSKRSANLIFKKSSYQIKK